MVVCLVVVDRKSLAKYFGGRGRNRKISTIAEKLLEASGKRHENMICRSYTEQEGSAVFTFYLQQLNSSTNVTTDQILCN